MSIAPPTSTSSLAGFAVSVDYEAERAVLHPRGEVDYLSAPDLGAILDAVIRQGRSVLLDLSDLDFIDASGLGVIATGAGRLAISGRTLAIRSASSIVVRMLDITGLSAVIRMEPAGVAAQHLGREQTITLPGSPVQAVDGLTRPLRQVASIPADDDVIDGALRLVVALARATVGGADGVSVSLRRHGKLSTVASSDETILEMDHDQYSTNEGPCVDASIEGRWFHVESLDTETRWPRFTPRARELGINAILSTPLLAQATPVGALNIYSRTNSAFAPADQELAATFATEASAILTRAGADVTDAELAARVQQALRGRQLIAQAQGIVMYRDGLSEDDAFMKLRESSTTAHQTLRARAEEVCAAMGAPSRAPSPAVAADRSD